MNISKATEHGYSNRALHNSGRFEKTAVDARGNNSQKIAAFYNNSATKVTISPEAQALNETEPSLSLDEKLKKFLDRESLVRTWLHEVTVEAIKNGTSIKAAVKEHGMEIAEYFAENSDSEYSEETLNRFLEGITRYMAGQSYKDAFNLSEGDCDYAYAARENDFLENKYGEIESALRKTREGYYEARKRGIDIEGVIFSYRYGCWISPPDNKAIQTDEEEVKKKVPQEKAAPQDKNEIFKDFAEQVIASHHKKKNKASYLSSAK